MTDIIDVVVANFITNVWANYDKDKSGRLDKQESRAFVQDLIVKVPGQLFVEKEFETLFEEFDKDKKGAIEKGVMTSFVKRLLKVEVAEVASAVKKGKKGKKEKKGKKGKKEKKGKKGKKGAVDLNVLNILTQQMGSSPQQQPQVVTEQIHHHTNTIEKIYLPGEIQIVTVPGQPSYTGDSAINPTEAKSNKKKIADESEEYDEEDDYDEEDEEGEATQRTQTVKKHQKQSAGGSETPQNKLTARSAIEVAATDRAQTTFEVDALPAAYSSGIVYTIGDDPYLLDFPNYKGWPQVQRSLQQQNGSPCPDMIYLTKTKICVQAEDSKKKGKYFMMLTSTAGDHSDTQYFKVEIKDNNPSSRLAKEDETFSVKSIVQNTTNPVVQRRKSQNSNGLLAPDFNDKRGRTFTFQNSETPKQPGSSRGRMEAPDFQQNKQRTFSKQEIATNTRLLKQDLKDLKLSSFSSVSKFLTNVAQDLPTNSVQSMSLLVSLQESLKQQTGDVTRLLPKVAKMIQEREAGSSQCSSESEQPSLKNFEQRIKEVVGDPQKTKIYLDRVRAELPQAQRVKILNELRSQLGIQRQSKEVAKALSLVNIEIGTLQQHSDQVSEDSLTERTHQNAKLATKAPLSSEMSSKQNYRSRDVSLTEERDEITKEEITARSKKLKKELLQVLDEPTKEDVLEFVAKVNRNLPSDSAESLTILKLLQESLLEEKPDEEIRQCLKKVNSEILKRQNSESQSSKRSTNSDRLRADFVKVTLDPTEPNVRAFVQKVDRNLSRDDPESQRILKELKRKLMQADQTPETKRGLKHLNQEIEVRALEVQEFKTEQNKKESQSDRDHRARLSENQVAYHSRQSNKVSPQTRKGDLSQDGPQNQQVKLKRSTTLADSSLKGRDFKKDIQKVVSDPSVNSVEKLIEQMDKELPNNSSESLEVLEQLSRQLSQDKQPSSFVKQSLSLVNNEIQRRKMKLNEDSTFDKSHKSFKKDDSRASLSNFIKDKFEQKHEDPSASDEYSQDQSSQGTFGQKKRKESEDETSSLKRSNIKIVDSRNNDSSDSEVIIGNQKLPARPSPPQKHGRRDHSPRSHSRKDHKNQKDDPKDHSRNYSHRRNIANVPNLQSNDAPPVPYSQQRESRRRSRQDRALFSPKTPAETVADAEFKRKFNNFFVQGSQLKNAREQENERWLQQQLHTDSSHQKVSNFQLPQQKQFTPTKPFPTTTKVSPMDKSPPLAKYSPGHNQSQFQVNQDNASPHNQFYKYSGSPNKPYSDSSVKSESLYPSPGKKPNPPKHISPRGSQQKNSPSPLKRYPYQNANLTLSDSKVNQSQEKDLIRDVSPKKALENLVRLKINQLQDQNDQLKDQIQEVKCQMQIPDRDLLPEGFVRDQHEDSFGIFDEVSLEEEKEINRQIRLQLETINQNITRLKQAVQHIDYQKIRQALATQISIQEQEQLLKSYIADQTNQAQVVKDKNTELEKELKEAQSAFVQSKELNKTTKRELATLTFQDNETNLELQKLTDKNKEAQARFQAQIIEIEQVQTVNEQLMNEITLQEAKLAKQEAEVEELRKQQAMLKEIKIEDEGKQQLQHARIEELSEEVQYMANQVHQKQQKLISEFAQLQKISNQIALAKSQHERERQNRCFKRQQELENQQRILQLELDNQELKESLSAKKRRLGLGPLTKAILEEYDDHLPEKQFMIKPYESAFGSVRTKSYSRESPQRQSLESLERGVVESPKPVVPQFVDKLKPFDQKSKTSALANHDVIGGGEDDLADSDRFTTTYQQFANQEKFRGPPEGERGGRYFSDFSPSWNQIQEDYKPPKRKELSSSRERLVNEGSEMAALLRPGHVKQVQLGQHTFSNKVSPTNRKHLLAKLPHLREELGFLQGERQAQKTIAKKRLLDEKITNVQNRILEIENQLFN